MAGFKRDEIELCVVTIPGNPGPKMFVKNDKVYRMIASFERPEDVTYFLRAVAFVCCGDVDAGGFLRTALSDLEERLKDLELNVGENEFPDVGLLED